MPLVAAGRRPATYAEGQGRRSGRPMLLLTGTQLQRWRGPSGRRKVVHTLCTSERPEMLRGIRPRRSRDVNLPGLSHHRALGAHRRGLQDTHKSSVVNSPAAIVARTGRPDGTAAIRRRHGHASAVMARPVRPIGHRGTKLACISRSNHEKRTYGSTRVYANFDSFTSMVFP
jgi:hypothetical protein